MSYVLGIDLGTSYSAAAIARDDGTVEIVQLGERAASIPSLVLLRADGEVLVGEAAERRSLTEPTRTAREFKRRLGDPVPLVLGGTPYGADALVAILLRAIVVQVVAQLDEAPRQVVITHPASYGPYKLDVLAGSLRQAGLDGATLIPEPVAAAIQYASQERVPDGAAIAVYDFGGGTFDASVLRKTATGFALLGDPEGLDRLGGIDFDEAILRHVIAVAGASAVPADSGQAATAAVARLREECRRAKEALSSDTDATIQIFGERRTDVRLTRSEFEAMIEPRIGETIDVLERAVRSAELRFEDLHRIVLVGGTSRIPRIAEIVHHRTGRPVAADTHPKHAVALGAARSALPDRERDVVRASPNRGGGVAEPVGHAEPVGTAAAPGVPAVPAAAVPAAAVPGAAGRPGRALLRGPVLAPGPRATRARAAPAPTARPPSAGPRSRPGRAC
jgi:molecular chaperone DnaK (HSP70)